MKFAIASRFNAEVLEARIAPGMTTDVQGLEHLALHVHALEHRLDDQIDIAQQVVFQGRVISAKRCARLASVERALAQRALVIAADVGESPIERILLSSRAAPPAIRH